MSKKTDISKLNKKAPFEVPKDYFEKLPDLIQTRIALENEEEGSMVFDSLETDKKLPFDVPQDYFQKLPEIIQSKIALEEKIGEVSKAEKKLPFEVPERYFDELPSIIQSKALESKKNRAFSFGMGSQQVKWALVPAMIAVFVISFSLFFNKQAKTYTTDELIAQVSSEDLIAYLEVSDISTDEIINSINFEELDLEFETEEPDMLDELDFSESEIDDILMEFDLETGDLQKI